MVLFETMGPGFQTESGQNLAFHFHPVTLDLVEKATVAFISST